MESNMESPTSVTGDDYMPTFYVGQHESRRLLPVTEHVLRQAQDCNYDMITTPITTPHFQSRVITQLSNYLEALRSHPSLSPPAIPELSPVDTPLVPGEVTSQLLAVASPWIDLASPDPLVYNISRQVLDLEIAYAAFCGIGNVIIPGPRLHHGNLHGEGATQYAYAIQEALSIGNYIQIQIWLPMTDHPDSYREDVEGCLTPFAREEYMGSEEEVKPRKADMFGTWDAWNIIRSVCKHNARLYVALSIPRHLPPLSIQSRWHSEPLRMMTFSGPTFILNSPGYPVLSKHHRELITKYMRIRNPPWILLCDVGPIPGLDNPDSRVSTADGFISESATQDAPAPAEAAQQKHADAKKPDDPTPQLSYIRWLQRKQPPRTTLERFGTGYQDYLQAPLQPLTDNLESITYEVFEKDPVKYNQYEKAIAHALSDWVLQGKPASGPNGRIVVAVVGAGRGPLVTRALQASAATGVQIELWAIEKNPNAYVLLQQHNLHSWQNRVNLVKSDMRSWKGPLSPPSQEHPPSSSGAPAPSHHHYPIDVLISELLGSFADNELSPECLDGVLPLLNPTHGLSIPSSYTAHLTPICAPKLHADIATRTPADPAAPNTPYVVMLHAIDYLSTTSPPPPAPNANTADNTPAAPTPNILPAWSFTHGPQPPLAATSMNKHNERHARLTFRTRDRGACHGLAGYFEAVLYPGTEISTHPLTIDAKSEGMMSWFPIFFPLKTPLYTPPHADLVASIWRRTDNRKVWYEWVVESFGYSRGVSGEMARGRLGVSEGGTSREGGCLM